MPSTDRGTESQAQLPGDRLERPKRREVALPGLSPLSPEERDQINQEMYDFWVSCGHRIPTSGGRWRYGPPPCLP